MPEIPGVHDDSYCAKCGDTARRTIERLEGEVAEWKRNAIAAGINDTILWGSTWHPPIHGARAVEGHPDEMLVIKQLQTDVAILETAGYRVSRKMRDVRDALQEWLDEQYDESTKAQTVLAIYEAHFGTWVPTREDKP